MKKFMFALASLALISAANAADGTETKFNGEIRGRYWSNINPAGVADTATNSAQESHWDQRSKLGVTFSKGEDLSGHIKLLAFNSWGTTYGSIASTGDLTQVAANSVIVHEAWGFWKASSNFSLRIGRGAMQVADGTVIATNEWQQNPKAFDGLLGTWYSDFANFNLFGVKAFDTVNTATVATVADVPEVNFYGVSMDVKNLPEALKMVNVHVLQSAAWTGSTTALAANNINSLRYGLTLAGAMNNFDYRGTYAGHSGKQNLNGGTSIDTAGSMFDLGVGYTWTDMMNAKLGALYHSDSGEDNTTANKVEIYETFHYDVHNNAGLMDIVKWGNATYIKVGASIEPMDMTKVGIDYYMFSRTTDKGLATFWETGFDSNASWAATNTEKNVGSEIDIYAAKTYDNGMTMSLFYGMFTPDNYLKKNAAGTAVERKTISQLGLEAKMVF